MGKGRKIICIPRSRLDTAWWDAHVEASQNGSVYGLSILLDIVAKKRWMVMWDEESECGIALAYRGWQKFPLKVGQPLFSRYGGVFYKEEPELRVWEEIQQHFPQTLLGLTTYFSFPALKINGCETRVYQALSMPDGFEADAHHRRHLRKADKFNLSMNNAQTDDLVSAFFAGRGKHYAHLNTAARERMLSLLRTLDAGKLGHCLQVNDSDGVVHAYGYFVKWRNELTYLHGALCDAGKSSSASYFLMKEAITLLGNGITRLDFGGSNDEGTARFYRGFGGKDVPYFSYSLKGLFNFLH